MIRPCPAPARMWGSRMRLWVAISVGIALPAQGETLMNPQDFEAWSTGRTLDYFDGLTYWGSEQHLPGRKTVDADDQGLCQNGVWFAQGDAICFVYEMSLGTHCWHFWREDDQVTARNVDSASEVAPYEVTLSEDPVSCMGPEVGV